MLYISRKLKGDDDDNGEEDILFLNTRNNFTKLINALLILKKGPRCYFIMKLG